MTNALNKFFQRWFGSPDEVAANDAPTSKSATAESQTAPAATPEPAPKPQAAAQPAPIEQTVAPVITAPAAEVPAAKPLVAWKPAIPIDAAFFDWLMGHPGEGSNFATEQKVLQALYGLLASDLNDAVLVPRMPSVIPQLLSSLRNKSVSTAELSRHILKDVALVGAVIKTVNSAMYNPADRINSLENAIMMLGEDGLRLLISKVAFNPIINLSSGQYTRRAAAHIWEQSEKCAIASHHLASETEINPFQAFLTGLMKNMGLIIAFRLLDQVCEDPKFKYSSSFRLSFVSVAATLSYRIAQRWDFPPYVIQALQQQAGGSKPIEWTPLGQLLHTADLISKMRVLVNHAQLMSNDERLKVGLPASASDCFDRLNQIHLFELKDVKIKPADQIGA